MSQGTSYPLKKVSDVAESVDSQGEFVFPRTTVSGRWHIKEKIGSGGFGAIYKAFDTQTKQFVAVKVEKRVGKSYLEKEVQFYKRLQGTDSLGCNVPRVHWSGSDGQYKVAVFDLMGPSLSDLFYSCRRKFSVKTVLMLADQLVSRLEYVHAQGVVHRDVKPGNFVMGTSDKAQTVFVIDFGLSNFWRDSTGKHIEYNQESAFRGTHRYASINSHFKSEQSRRDDLEALGYVLIYFACGGLPWQNIKVARHKRRKSIGRFKDSVPLEELTRGLPLEFAKYMSYVRNLKFEETPNYEYLRSLFSGCMRRLNLTDDRVFDWMQPQAPVAPPAVPNSMAAAAANRVPKPINAAAPISISSTDERKETAKANNPEKQQQVVYENFPRPQSPAITSSLGLPLSPAPAMLPSSQMNPPAGLLSTPQFRRGFSTSNAVPSTPASQASDLTSSAGGIFFGSPASAVPVSLVNRSSLPPSPQRLPSSPQHYLPPVSSTQQQIHHEDEVLQLSSGSDGLNHKSLAQQVESPLGVSTTSIISNMPHNTNLSAQYQSTTSPQSPPALEADEDMCDKGSINTTTTSNKTTDAPYFVDLVDEDLIVLSSIPPTAGTEASKSRKRKRTAIEPAPETQEEDMSIPKRRSLRLQEKQHHRVVEAI